MSYSGSIKTLTNSELKHLIKLSKIRQCGNCKYFMTRTCPQEKNINGRNYGPSYSELACSKLTYNHILEIYEQELFWRTLNRE